MGILGDCKKKIKITAFKPVFFVHAGDDNSYLES